MPIHAARRIGDLVEIPLRSSAAHGPAIPVIDEERGETI
jgi:hypothetical protein